MVKVRGKRGTCTIWLEIFDSIYICHFLEILAAWQHTVIQMDAHMHTYTNTHTHTHIERGVMTVSKICKTDVPNTIRRSAISWLTLKQVKTRSKTTSAIGDNLRSYITLKWPCEYSFEIDVNYLSVDFCLFIVLNLHGFISNDFVTYLFVCSQYRPQTKTIFTRQSLLYIDMSDNREKYPFWSVTLPPMLTASEPWAVREQCLVLVHSRQIGKSRI